MKVLSGKVREEYEAVIDVSRVWSAILASWMTVSRIGYYGG